METQPTPTPVTLDRVRCTIAAVIASSPLSERLVASDRARLEEPNALESGSFSSLHLTFRQERICAHGEATLHISVNRRIDTSSRRPNGDLVGRFSLHVRASWPAWGADDVGPTLLRAGLIHEVALLAEAIDAAITAPIEDVWSTAAELADEERQNVQRANLAMAQAVLDELNPRMQVGSVRPVDAARVKAPYPTEGSYVAIRAKKVYTMAFRGGALTITRTS